MDKLLIGVAALQFLKERRFSVLESVLARDGDEAVRAAAKIGFPVALKISSDYALHKTEVGGVATGLHSEAAAVEGFHEIVGRFKAKNPGVEPDGVIVQRQADGFELIVGVSADQQFGPVLMFGLGGIFAEALQDVSFRLIPVEPKDAADMIEELKGYDTLKRPRKGPVDLSAIRDFLVSVSELIVTHPEIREMDLNPVFVSSRGLEICDARIGFHDKNVSPG